VGRQGNGGAGVHGREDPGVLLPGDDTRLPRRALMAGGGGGGTDPPPGGGFQEGRQRGRGGQRPRLSGRPSRRSTCGWVSSPPPASSPRRGVPPTGSGSTSAHSV